MECFRLIGPWTLYTRAIQNLRSISHCVSPKMTVEDLEIYTEKQLPGSNPKGVPLYLISLFFRSGLGLGSVVHFSFQSNFASQNTTVLKIERLVIEAYWSKQMTKSSRVIWQSCCPVILTRIVSCEPTCSWLYEKAADLESEKNCWESPNQLRVVEQPRLESIFPDVDLHSPDRKMILQHVVVLVLVGWATGSPVTSDSGDNNPGTECALAKWRRTLHVASPGVHKDKGPYMFT